MSIVSNPDYSPGGATSIIPSTPTFSSSSSSSNSTSSNTNQQQTTSTSTTSTSNSKSSGLAGSTTLPDEWYKDWVWFPQQPPPGKNKSRQYVFKASFDPYPVGGNTSSSTIKKKGARKLYDFLKEKYDNVPGYNLDNNEKQQRTRNNTLPRLVYDETKFILENEFYRAISNQAINRMYSTFSTEHAARVGATEEDPHWISVPVTFRNIDSTSLGNNDWKVSVPFPDDHRHIRFKHPEYHPAKPIRMAEQARMVHYSKPGTLAAFYRGLRLHEHVEDGNHPEDYEFYWGPISKGRLEKQRWQLISWFNKDELSSSKSSSSNSSSSDQGSSAALEAAWTQKQLLQSYVESFESIGSNIVQVDFSSAQDLNQAMSLHEYTDCYERIMSLPRTEIADRCKQLVLLNIPLFDFYELDPRTNKVGKYFLRDAISLAELNEMSLGNSIDKV